MDVSGIRLQNYKALLLQFRARPDQAGLSDHGFLTRFADHAGVSARYLSHINNGRKNIGESVARQLESGFNLPHGWLDNDHSSPAKSLTETERQFAETALRLFRESPVEAQAMLMRYMLERLETVGQGDR